MNATDDPLPRFGPHFTLRRLTSVDLPAFQAYRHDPDVGRYQAWSPLSDDAAAAFLDAMGSAPWLSPGHWNQIAIAAPHTGRLIGDIGVLLDRDGRHAEVGFTLAREAQGRGIATAAVRETIGLIFAGTAVDRVLAITDARNLRSARLLERIGMRRMEVRTVPFRGSPCEEHVYALPRDDA